MPATAGNIALRIMARGDHLDEIWLESVRALEFVERMQVPPCERYPFGRSVFHPELSGSSSRRGPRR